MLPDGQEGTVGTAMRVLMAFWLELDEAVAETMAEVGAGVVETAAAADMLCTAELSVAATWVLEAESALME